MMKKHYLALSLAAASCLFTACDKQFEPTPQLQQEKTEAMDYFRAPTFAEPDNFSKQLNGTPSENLMAIFESTGPKIITSMGRMNITEEQFQEIKAFTYNLVKSCTTDTEKYNKIFGWIRENVNYGHSDPDPYAVFQNKLCVCQGYANLITVMCYSQDIPIVVVNGLLHMPEYGIWGGHAWAYTCLDGVWTVSDPTNDGTWAMSNTGQYKHLKPSEADVDLFADDYAVYRYFDSKINVDRVTTTSNPLVVPYSVGGFVINSFNPSEALPATITDIYLGENIITLGDNIEANNMRLSSTNYGDAICAIYVDEKNPALLGHKGVVYRKNGDEVEPYYIPGGMEFVEMLPLEVVGKNTICNHRHVKEIYFPAGTMRIEDYAIEACPKLERIYVPEGAEIANEALYDCPQNVEIIRGIPNSIKHIYAD